MAEVIAANGFVKKDVYRSDTCHGAWLAPILARAMASKAGLGEPEIEKAFRPEGGWGNCQRRLGRSGQAYWGMRWRVSSNIEFFGALIEKRGVMCSELVIFGTISVDPRKSEVQQNAKQISKLLGK
jgi:hypothetical protein